MTLWAQNRLYLHINDHGCQITTKLVSIFFPKQPPKSAGSNYVCHSWWGRWLGVFEGVKCQKTPKNGGQSPYYPIFLNFFLYYSHFFLLDRFKSVSSACSENLAAFGTYLVPLWTKTARAKNRDFRFDDPTLTACNLTQGPRTIFVSIFAPMGRMDLSIDASDDPSPAPPSRENGRGSLFTNFFSKFSK